MSSQSGNQHSNNSNNNQSGNSNNNNNNNNNNANKHKYYFEANPGKYYFKAYNKPPPSPFDPNPPYVLQNGIEAAIRGGKIDFGPQHKINLSDIDFFTGLKVAGLSSATDHFMNKKIGMNLSACSNYVSTISMIDSIRKDIEEHSFYNTTKEVSVHYIGKYVVKTVVQLTPWGRTSSILVKIVSGIFEYAFETSLSNLFDILRDLTFLSIQEISAGLKRLINKYGRGGIEFKHVKPIVGIKSPEVLLSLKSNIFFETKYEKEVREAFNSLCLPNFQNRKIKDYFETIYREISNGINIMDELPFVSLHFNNNHLLYSVMGSYYRNTLVGNVLAYMDYFLKGFVNGGFFNIEFIKSWVKVPPQERMTDLKKLNQNLIDIRKILKNIDKNTPYRTIYDFVNQEKMIREFTSAFRIIGEMNIVETADNIFFPKPTFSVQHDINPSPSLQKLLAKGGPEHDEFLELHGNFFKMNTIIHDIMPKVPYFRGFFFILDMITFAIYYNQSLQSIGKTIETSNSFQSSNEKQDYVDIIPEVFPPLPVSFRKRISPEITRGEILESLQGTSLNKEIENSLFNQKYFSESFLSEFQNNLIVLYRNKVSSILKDELFIYDDDDIHLFSFLIKALGFIKSLDIKIANKMIKGFSIFIPEERRNELDEQDLTYPLIEAECTRYFDEYKQKMNEIIINNNKTLQNSKDKIQILIQKKEEHTNMKKSLDSTPVHQRYQPDYDEFYALVMQNLNSIEHDISIYEDRILKCQQMNDFINNILTQKQKEMDDIKKASHNFLQVYKEIMKTEKIIQNEFFISKPVIAEFEDGNSIEGGCLINVHKIPTLIKVTKSSKQLNEIHSFLTNNNDQNQEFICCSNGNSGYVMDFDIIPVFSLGKKLTLDRANDFFRENNLCYNKIDLPHIAAKFELTEFMNDMSEKEVNQETSDGMTPAFFACAYNSLQSIDMLIKKGADFNKTLQSGLYPFLSAIESGYYTTTLYLLLNDPNIIDVNKATETGMTPLHWAIYYNFPDIVDILLKKGASLLIGLKGDGMRPIHLACYLNRLECLSILSSSPNATFDETESGYSPLHISIKHSPQCAAFLIQKGLCDLNLLDPHEYTMKDMAILNGQYDIANKLPDKGELKSLLEKEYNENDSDGLFENLLMAFETGDNAFTERVYAKWSKENQNKNDLTSKQKQQLIDSACNGRCVEFVEILSRILKLEETSISLTASHHGLNEWIPEIMKYGGNLMCEVDQRTILDEAVDNKDNILIRTILSIVKNVPEKVFKRIIKKAIKNDDLNTIREISKALKNDDYSNIKLKLNDILFSFTTEKSFLILQKNLDPNENFQFNIFIESISFDLASYILDNYSFSRDDLITSGIKAFKAWRHDIVYLIIEKDPSIVQEIASNRSCSDVIKITKDNLEEIKNAIINMINNRMLSDEYKSKQLMSLMRDKFYVGEIKCFENYSLIDFAGGSMSFSWILLAIPQQYLFKFYLSEHALEQNFIFYLLFNLMSIFEKLVGKKKAGSMFLNSLRKINFQDLDLKGLGDEFIESLIKIMSVNHLYDVDDDDQSIFHIIAKFTHINVKNIKRIHKLIENEKESNNFKKLINTRSRNGNILMEFALSGNYFMLKMLLEAGSDLKIRDIYGNNVLHNALDSIMATNNNVINCVSSLVKECPELIIQRNRKGKNAFMIAAQKGFNGVLGLMSTYYPISLLDSSPKKSVIHLAAKNNYPETIRYIVQNLHIDVNKKSKKNYTPLHYAAMYGSMESFKELIELGANPLISSNKIGVYSPIVYGLLYGSEEMIDMIMKIASFNLILCLPKILTHFVVNPESYYSFSKILEIVDLNCLSQCDEDGDSLVSLACLRNNTKTLSDLLLIGCNPYTSNFNGQNSIHTCALYNSIGCSSLILNHINEIDGLQGVENILCSQDSKGDNPLHIAVRKGYKGFVLHLLISCSDFDLEIPNNSGNTPFAESIKNDNFDIAGILCCHYINIRGKSLESLKKLILPNFHYKFEQFLSSEGYKNGMNIENQIKKNLIKYPSSSGKKPNIRIPLFTIDAFLINLQINEIYLNLDFIIHYMYILSNYYFQMKILSHLQEEGVVKYIFESMLKINTQKILDIACLAIFPNVEKGEMVKKLFDLIINLDSLNIKESHPLFSWIENGLLSIAETVKNTQSVLSSIENLFELINFIGNDPELMSSIDYPILPSPIHVVASSIFKIKEKQHIPIQIKFANIMNVSMLWMENPSLSIDVCNRLGKNQNLLIDYAIDQQLGESEIERIIQITLELYEDVSLNDDVRILIMNYCKDIADKTSTKSDFSVWISNSIKVIRHFGIKYFKSIIPIIPHSTLKIANEALSAIITIGSAEIANKKLINKGIDELKNVAENIKKKKFIESRNLEEILEAFKGRSNGFVPYQFSFDGTPVIKLSNDEINDLRIFGELLEKQGNFISISDVSYEIGKEFRDNPTIENAAKLVALTRQAINEVFGIKPFIVQCLTVFSLLLHRINKKNRQLKGRIAQVATGEGKSIIVAMLTGSIALTGSCVDVISSSMYLAERDAEKFKPFYEKIGLKCGTVSERDNPNGFDYHVLYSTNIGFEFALLREGSKGGNYIQTSLLYENNKKHRPFMTAIVDEADNLFIDTAANSAIISQGGNNKLTWIFKPIWECVCNLIISPELIRKKLKLTADVQQLKDLKNLTNKRIKKYVSNAFKAINLKKDVDYIIGPDINTGKTDILIVDADNTGRIKHGSRWMNGLHEFVELKEGIPVREQSYTVASISHPSFFMPYEELYGLTGTLGEEIERDEIRRIYNVDSFDVPPNRQCQRIRQKTLIVSSEEKKTNLIIEKIREITAQGRPILVIARTIHESQELSKLLHRLSIKHYILNDQQEQDEDFIIERAGKPGSVTIATNTAGRGTDIRVDEIALQKGGLHTLITFFPANLRVECQALGRSGRQGQKGSCQIIFASKEFGSDNSETTDEILKSVYDKRTDEIKINSLLRGNRFLKEQKVYEVLKLYFDYFRYLNDFLKRQETKLILKNYYPNKNSFTIKNELMECWGEYFTSTTSDQQIPSYQDFLDYWGFHKKYVFLFQPFNEIIPDELKLIEEDAPNSILSKSIQPVKNNFIKCVNTVPQRSASNRTTTFHLSEDLINDLVEMGFEKRKCEQALSFAENDFKYAINILMNFNSNNKNTKYSTDQDNLSQLISDGFDKKLSQYALSLADNDFDVAFNLLANGLIKNVNQKIIQNPQSEITDPVVIEMINNLVSMGFDNFSSENSLKKCKYDFKSALNLLNNSKKNEINSRNDQDLNNNIQNLINIGFEKKLVEHALKLKNNNFKDALAFLSEVKSQKTENNENENNESNNNHVFDLLKDFGDDNEEEEEDNDDENEEYNEDENKNTKIKRKPKKIFITKPRRSPKSKPKSKKKPNIGFKLGNKNKDDLINQDKDKNENDDNDEEENENESPKSKSKSKNISKNKPKKLNKIKSKTKNKQNTISKHKSEEDDDKDNFDKEEEEENDENNKDNINEEYNNDKKENPKLKSKPKRKSKINPKKCHIFMPIPKFKIIMFKNKNEEEDEEEENKENKHEEEEDNNENKHEEDSNKNDENNNNEGGNDNKNYEEDNKDTKDDNIDKDEIEEDIKSENENPKLKSKTKSNVKPRRSPKSKQKSKKKPNIGSKLRNKNKDDLINQDKDKDENNDNDEEENENESPKSKSKSKNISKNKPKKLNKIKSKTKNKQNTISKHKSEEDDDKDNFDKEEEEENDENNKDNINEEYNNDKKENPKLKSKPKRKSKFKPKKCHTFMPIPKLKIIMLKHENEEEEEEEDDNTE